MTVSDLSRPAELPSAPDNDVIALPEAVEISALHAEFAGRFSSEVIEHTLAVARHVLERSHANTTHAAVEALARESLQLRGPKARP